MQSFSQRIPQFIFIKDRVYYTMGLDICKYTTPMGLKTLQNQDNIILVEKQGAFSNLLIKNLKELLEIKVAGNSSFFY